MRLADPEVASDPKEYMRISKQAAGLNDVIAAYEEYLACQEELAECKQMAKEAAGDAEMLVGVLHARATLSLSKALSRGGG
jgi:peptide chain release factor 1